MEGNERDDVKYGDNESYLTSNPDVGTATSAKMLAIDLFVISERMYDIIE